MALASHVQTFFWFVTQSSTGTRDEPLKKFYTRAAPGEHISCFICCVASTWLLLLAKLKGRYMYTFTIFARVYHFSRDYYNRFTLRAIIESEMELPETSSQISIKEATWPSDLAIWRPCVLGLLRRSDLWLAGLVSRSSWIQARVNSQPVCLLPVGVFNAV